jgi:glyoxylase-like metal-dependent hydrolase (beta-lactamase superfamily II)
VLLTHIHLDHAGCAGSLVQRWPELQVYVHERGAPHLIDPERLVTSATRLYGDDMGRLWGEMLPVPEHNLTLLAGGERLLGGAYEVAYTPGHASHHVSYLHDATAFVGDVCGVRITAESMAIPPTPPPDIDVEAWHESLALIAAWKPVRLAMTHFGASHQVQAQLLEVGARLDAWAELARDRGQESFIATVQDQIRADCGPELAATYQQAAPAEQLYAGLDRYWQKRAKHR